MIGQTTAFKTSTGAEVRFFMPVLNVPFRLIFAYNPQRFPVLDNSLRPARNSRSSSPLGRLFNMRATEGADGAEFMMLRVLITALAMAASACSGLIDEFPTTPDPR